MSTPSEPHPQTGQPVGLTVDATPAKLPGPVTLPGRHGRVEKLSPNHARDLWAAFEGHDRIWTYLPPDEPFTDAAAFAEWVGRRAVSVDLYCYAIVDADDRAVGIAALMAARPDMRVIEVGYIIYGSTLQRSPLGTEAQYLLARYAFETLGNRRYEWKCNALNAASRAAALRYGFVFEGVHRQHMIAKGRNRDTAWYSMLDSEWPARKAAFERWLSPDNFDAEGRQRASLVTLRNIAD